MAELLFVPLKKSSDVDIVKPLKNLIQSTYNTGESHEDYSEALNELSRLRTNAIWKVFEKSSLEILYSYYDQLASLESKLPPQEVQVPFKWKDAFDKGSIFGGRMSLTVSSLAYERMCVLFNIAAQQSALAAQQALDTEDSLKLAAKLLQQSAGVFGYLKANVLLAVHQETTPDLAPDTLAALAALMLAQAQEVIAYKCIRDEMKDSMVAKVCAQAEELYTEALRAMQREQVRQLWERAWLPAVTAKQALMRGLAQYYQAQVCRQNKAVGEEIARLQLAAEHLRAAAGAAGAPPGPAADIVPKAARQLASAIKDNDFIYHERIPEARQLEAVPRAAVAKPLAPPARWAAGKDLFDKLVPAQVHQALQTAAARRSELVNAEIAKLRDATALLNSVLASLSLPACLENCSGGLPTSVRDQAAAVRAKGGVQELHRLMRELPELLQRNTELLDEAERLLREEAEADAALREQFGARWTRTPSERLTDSFRANADKYRQIIDNAIRADNIVQQKFQQHKENIELLSGNEGDLSAGVPAAEAGAEAGAGADADEAAASALRRLMARVAELKAERDQLELALKDVTIDLKDQFLSALAADGALDEPALSAGGAAGRAAARARGAAGGARRRLGPRRRAGPPRRRQRRLPGPHLQPQRGRQVLQRPHAAAAGVPEQGVGLLLRAQDGEGGAAEGPHAGGRPPRPRRALTPAALSRRAGRGGAPLAAAAPPTPVHERRPRPRRPLPRARRPRSLRAALPAATSRHAGAVRRGRVRVLRAAAHARAVQPVRHAALPAPRPHAAATALPALPVPAPSRRLPAPARRVQPLPAAVAPSVPRQLTSLFLNCTMIEVYATELCTFTHRKTCKNSF